MRSRRFLIVFLMLWSTELTSFSLDASAQPSEKDLAETPAAPAEVSDSLPLVLTYAATPLAALGAAAAFADADDTVGGIVGGSAAAVIVGGPFVVHGLDGRLDRGAIASPLLPAFDVGRRLRVGFARAHLGEQLSA